MLNAARTVSLQDSNPALVLYQGDIVRYGHAPNNFGALPNANVQVQGDSPICGDHMRLYLDFRGASVRGVQFSSSACCAVCKASASMMTDALQHQSLIEVHLLRRAFLQLLEGQDLDAAQYQRLGPLRIFERLRQLPERLECALLPWTTLATALDAPELLEPA